MPRLGRRAALLGAALLPLPDAMAQTGRVPRIGALFLTPWTAPAFVAFRAAMAQQGYAEGQGIAYDPEGHGLPRARFAAHAARLVERQVDLIMTSGDAGITAAMEATRRIPILCVTENLVLSGFARSFAQPGGNVTGVSVLASELDAKRQEILIGLLPGARRLAALGEAGQTAPEQLEAHRAAARRHGVELLVRLVREAGEIAPALAALREAGAEGVNVLGSTLLFAQRAVLFARCAALRLPAVYQWPGMAEEGGLVGYGPNLVGLYRDQVAPMAVRLLRGTPPASLPVEQPSRFELVINRHVAQALGLALPLDLLGRADAVID